MRIVPGSLLLLVLAGSFSLAQSARQEQPPQPDPDACKFTVKGEPTHPTIIGPDDIVPLVYVVEQPDSPIEIESIDLTGTWVNVANGELWHKDCARYTVRNRSDRAINGTWLELGINGFGGSGAFGPRKGSPLEPGGTLKIEGCKTGGHTGGVSGDRTRLLVLVTSVEFAGCTYKPSVRIPRSLGIAYVR